MRAKYPTLVNRNIFAKINAGKIYGLKVIKVGEIRERLNFSNYIFLLLCFLEVSSD